jgi:DNA-binding CsgD family transcriptional regulator/tetratricopeptide (TPR) repeat protein
VARKGDATTGLGHDEEMTGVSTSSARLVGRTNEQRLLRLALQAAAAGEPCAVVVHGEAGIGKTRLVRDAVDRAAVDLGATVAWGTCVQFGASTLQYAPMLHALHNVLPSPVGSAPTTRMLPMIDAAVNEVAGRQPMVLVIDDLQWADVSSLDALAYLIAGFDSQMLAIVATCRDEHRPEGHPLHGWLADMRRMPSFTELPVDRLDLEQTAALLAQLRDEPPDLELAALVLARSDGNPYLTELLGSSLKPGVHEIPRGTPDRLRDALTAAWHRLDPVARDVSRLLAVGGRPVERAVLTEVAVSEGIDAADVGPALTSSAAQGVVAVDHDGRLWFRHPLLADVLYDAMPPDAVVRAHATFAAVLARAPQVAPADLAVHHERAGNNDEAFRWSLVAASSAAELHASAEEAQHLVRACSLWPHLTECRRRPAERVDLLYRASRASRLSSRYDDAKRLLETARNLLEEMKEPLVLSRLLSEWCEVTWEASGPTISRVPERYDAVRLTEDFPDSIERVSALTGLATAEAWDCDFVSARRHADQAVDAARRNGSDLALAQALNTWGFVALSMREIEPAEARAAIEEALELARRCGDAKEVVSGTIWLMNLLYEDLELNQAAGSGEQAVDEAIRLGDLHWCYFVSSMTADVMLLLGRFEDARGLLREALAVRCVGVPGAASRLAAGKLANRTGELEAARSHLDRALEVVEPGFSGLHEQVTEAVAELRIAEGDPVGALEWVRSRAVEVDGSVDTEVQIWHARALADIAQLARDAGDAEGDRGAQEELEQWMVLARKTTPDLVDPEEGVDQVFALVTAAEISRCRNEPDEMDRWERVIRVCRSTGIRWEEGCALRRLAEAGIRRNAPRQFIAATLRRLHELATDMGAHPLREQAERLARVARVNLEHPHVIPAQTVPRSDEALPGEGLTTREREILGHLVAGRTNTEIASTLVISPKTVSVHVSNILRKTGSRSRAEAAAKAIRPT